MAIWTEENVIPSLIANTTMVKRFADGVHKTYKITPNPGYVLHDNRHDEYAEYDDNGNPIGEPIRLGYYSGTRSVSASYDFDNVVQAMDGTTAVYKIGEYGFYAIPSSDIGNGQIFGGGTEPDHEIM